MSFTLTDSALTGLFYIQRYRYLTIKQFAHITDSSYDKTAHLLRVMERKNVLGHFGNIPFGGHGKAPKVYYLTKKGHGFLMEHLEELQDEIGGYKKVNTDTKWTSKMPHNLHLIDCFLAIEKQVSKTNKYRLISVFTENKKVRKDGRIQTETTDFISEIESSETRIIPDGAFILERIEDQKRFLFFLEYDNGTETIESKLSANYHKTVQYKFSQYVKYYKSGRYKLKYQEQGDFKFFFMLFVTDSQKRVENISDSLGFVSSELRRLFYISHLEQVLADFFFNSWNEPAGKAENSRPLIKSS